MRLLISAAIIGVFAVSVHRGATLAEGKVATVDGPCSVSGAKYPELMPEYYVWEVYFRNHTIGASGELEGLQPPTGQQFHPGDVRNNARHLGIADADMIAFLEVGTKALKQLDHLRASGNYRSDTDGSRARQDAAEVILDARDAIARFATRAARS